MGYRMSIWPEGKPDEAVGDDHKLYAYTSFENVQASFTYLFDIALSKTEDFEDYLEFEEPAREAYSAFCCIGCSPEMIMTNKEFEVFTALYLLDLIKGKPNLTKEDFDIISGYMHKMSSIPGNKILQWS